MVVVMLVVVAIAVDLMPRLHATRSSESDDGRFRKIPTQIA